ncbi:MAG: acetyl/propionyl/methylcrotonyl-CoA carboxylase subunit alpha [Hyphomicrobiaceae bacterium]
MLRKVLVANRGAVAARVIRALAHMNVASVAVYSDADRDAPYLEMASEARRIGPAPADESYLNQEALLACLEASGADALHPGYGFLSENAAFACCVVEAGAAFIGPSPSWIEDMGNKVNARAVAARYGLPLMPGSGALEPGPALLETGRRIGFPVLVKAAGGGGGIGMLPAHSEEELLPAAERAGTLARRFFGSGLIYLERLLDRPRHIEIQILGDRHGNAMHVFERECSIQRRHQKVIEEAPAPGLARDRIDGLAASTATKLAAGGYDSLGTVEMLMDANGNFSFLEMNTRLQVEHGVTEEITGLDLVQAQIRAAAGERLSQIVAVPAAISGHAIQARIYAEDPVRFLPSPGRLEVFCPPACGARVETGYREGMDVTPHYDPLLAKVIVHRSDREQARVALMEALQQFAVAGVKTNIAALLKVLDCDEFKAGRADTQFLSRGVAKKGGDAR